MTFSRPTLTELKARALSDMDSELNNGASFVNGTFERATALVQAGLAHSQYGFLQYLAKQIVPTLSDEEYLLQWVELFMGADARNSATAAAFTITVTGIDGTTIPSGTVWANVAGNRYASETDYDISGTDVSVQVVSLDVGSDQNVHGGETLTLEAPITGVESAATVEGTTGLLVGGGTAIEQIETLRERFITYLQTPPKGGARGNYAGWAKEVDIVTRAWEIPFQLGPGTVVVIFVQDTFNEDGLYSDTVFPNAAAVQTVRDYLDARIPITVNPSPTDPSGHIQYVFSATRRELNPVIALRPNDATTRNQVSLYLADLLLRNGGPNTTITLSQLNEAISLAPGEVDHVMTSPSENVVSGALDVYVLGTPTFVDME